MIERTASGWRVLDDYWFHVLARDLPTKEAALLREAKMLKEREEGHIPTMHDREP